NVFVNGLRVSSYDGTPIPTIEAESGTLGANYLVTTIGGATAIAPASTNPAFTPGAADRVATYSVTFSAANTYQLYVRVYVGPAAYDDDSFFYASSFGVKNPTNGGDWVAVLSGLVETGYTNSSEQIV